MCSPEVEIANIYRLNGITDVDDDWVAVKADMFKEPSDACKLRPNFHVSWNEQERKFCITFNEHSRVQSDTQQRCSYSTTFTIEQLFMAHRSLCLVAPGFCKAMAAAANRDASQKDSLNKTNRTDFDYLAGFETIFPELIPEMTWSEYFLSKVIAKPSDWCDGSFGSWRQYIFAKTRAAPPSNLMDKICFRLENYFSDAYRRCSHFTFISTIFSEVVDDDFDAYFENMHELRHRTFVERLEKSKQHFDSLVESRRKTHKATRIKRATLTDDASVAAFELAGDLSREFLVAADACVEECCDLLAEFHVHLSQPFLELREIARSQADKWRRRADDGGDVDLGAKAKADARRRLATHRREIANSGENLRDLQAQYYAHKRSLLSNYLEVLQFEAKHPIGDYENVALLAKLFDIEKRLAFANLNYSACLIPPVKTRRKCILQQMSRLDTSSPSLATYLSSLEQEFYNAQNEYFSVHIRLLQDKDKYLTVLLKEIRRNCKLSCNNGQQDEEGDVFYDTAYNERELSKFVDKYSDSQPKIKILKCESESIHSKLASLRTKKKKLEYKIKEGRGALLNSLAKGVSVTSGLKTILDIENSSRLTSINEKLKLDRQTTVQRIRSYRSKNLKSISDASINAHSKPLTPTNGKLRREKTTGSKVENRSSSRNSITPTVPVSTPTVLISAPSVIPPNASPAPTATPTIATPIPPAPPPPPPISALLSLGGQMAETPNFKLQIPKNGPNSSARFPVSPERFKTSPTPHESITAAIKSGQFKLKKVVSDDDAAAAASRENRPGRKTLRVFGAGDANARLLAEMMSKIRKMTRDDSPSSSDREGSVDDFDAD